MSHRGLQDLTILWFAGVNWDTTPGTDHRLVNELSSHATVLWVDPPHAFWRAPGLSRHGLEWIAPQTARILVPTVPFSTSRPVRPLVARQSRWVVRRALSHLGRMPDIQVVASPIQRFLPDVHSTRVYYQTDDWEEGAGLMGFSRSWVTESIRANSATADVVTAVTPTLLNDVMAATAPTGESTIRRVLANGCEIPENMASLPERDEVAGIMGQLNERLDLDLLAGVIDRGIPLRIIGPRRDRAPEFSRRLDMLLSAPDVDYLGAVPPEEVPRQLARMGVGLTPYANTKFNASSFPLKTLEYLASGLGVVSSDLPAVAWLNTDLIAVGRTRDEFSAAVENLLKDRGDRALEQERQHFARGHTWSVRATELLDLARLPEALS